MENDTSLVAKKCSKIATIADIYQVLTAKQSREKLFHC